MWPLPSHGLAIGASLAVDASGGIWYTQGLINGTSINNYVGVLRGGSIIEEWQISTPGADPAGIDINPVTQQPWLVEQSTRAGNGGLAVLANSAGGSLASVSPVTAPSGGSPVILAPQTTTVSASVKTVTPITSLTVGNTTGSYLEYSFGSGLPRDVVIDSEGNVWTTQPANNKIVRVSGFQPDYGLAVTPPYLTVPRTSSGTVTVTGTSIAGYTGSIYLTAKSIPQGVTLSNFSPSPLNVPADANASASVTINVSANALAGPAIVTFAASDRSIDHTTSIILVVTNSTTGAPPTSQCLIATASFGSYLGSEVQALREFRDGQVARSKAGSAFLLVLNSWYYSFSPFIAKHIHDSPVLRGAVGDLLFPLLAFLSLASMVYAPLSWNAELATIVAGLVASFLIGAVYVGLPLALAWRRRRRLDGSLAARALLAALIGVLLGELMGNQIILMFFSSMAVIFSLWTSALLTAKSIGRSTDHVNSAN
jgi:hypothetical protein